MKRFLPVLLAAAFACLASSSALAQQAPESSYTFGEAKAHQHLPHRFGTFCGRSTVADPTNTVANLLFGNTLCLKEEGASEGEWYWYNDPNPRENSATWTVNVTQVEIVYDPVCKLVTSAVRIDQ